MDATAVARSKARDTADDSHDPHLASPIRASTTSVRDWSRTNSVARREARDTALAAAVSLASLRATAAVVHYPQNALPIRSLIWSGVRSSMWLPIDQVWPDGSLTMP